MTFLSDRGSGDDTISVIVPTWNRATQTSALVKAVLDRQTDPAFDLVIVDDGSTDDTLDVLGSVDDDRLNVLARPHLGVCAARNAGAAAVNTEWLVFLDSDDLPDPDWIESFRRMMHADADLLSVGQRRRLPDGSETVVSPEPLGAAFAGVAALWQAGAFMMRRRLFEEVGRYRDGLAFSENTDLAFRIARRHEHSRVRCSIDPEPRYSVLVRAGRYDPTVQLESALDILRDHPDRLGLEPALLADYEAIAGVAASRLGERRHAVQHLRRAVQARPLDLRHTIRLVRAVVSA